MTSCSNPFRANSFTALQSNKAKIESGSLGRSFLLQSEFLPKKNFQLSTKGTANDIPLPLKHFLDYVYGQPPADDFVKEIDNEVMMAKRREDWRREYMTLNILIAREKKKSEDKGRIEATMSSIRAVMQSLNYSAEKAMETLNIPKSEYGRYMQLL